MSEDHIPDALWAKVDLILDKVNKTDIAIARIEGDHKLQNQVMQHSTELLRELKQATNDNLKEFDRRIAALEEIKNRAMGAIVGLSLISGIVTAIIVSYIKTIFGKL